MQRPPGEKRWTNRWSFACLAKCCSAGRMSTRTDYGIDFQFCLCRKAFIYIYTSLASLRSCNPLFRILYRRSHQYFGQYRRARLELRTFSHLTCENEWEKTFYNVFVTSIGTWWVALMAIPQPDPATLCDLWLWEAIRRIGEDRQNSHYRR